MEAVILLAFISVATARSQRYDLATHHGNKLMPGMSFENGRSLFPCRKGETQNIDGSCVKPIINRFLYKFDVPEIRKKFFGKPPALPPPKLIQHYILIRLPQRPPAPDPIIIPPPRRNTVVYVLNRFDGKSREVIKLGPHLIPSPEVYFINYRDGENPLLPSGENLKNSIRSGAKGGSPVKNRGLKSGSFPFSRRSSTVYT